MRRVTGENIKRVLEEHVEPTAVLMTDQSGIYPEGGSKLAGHESVDHSAGEYVRYAVDGGPHIHSNTVEGYFSQLKRSIDGTHHHVTERHLGRYLAEFDLRYSTRDSKDADRAVLMIRKTAGKRLTYRKPTASE